MLHQESLLVTLLKQVDRLPMPTQAVPMGRGRPRVYADRVFMKALLMMIVRHFSNVYEFYMALQQPSAEMLEWRELLSTDGHFPSRRTWERRLNTIPATLPDQIGYLGRHLIEQMGLWETAGRAVAFDSTVLRASGSVWHKKQGEKGEIPVGSIDTEAYWTRIRLPWMGLRLEIACGSKRGRHLGASSR